MGCSCNKIYKSILVLMGPAPLGGNVSGNQASPVDWGPRENPENISILAQVEHQKSAQTSLGSVALLRDDSFPDGFLHW